ncbi:MAG: tRNA (adenosine(37)-N6)-threonylcarbamoyltransferase complex transferase subunit TsaD [Patescibacteria group bacterium]
MKKTATILSIETSCDETAVALVRGEKTTKGYNLIVEENLVHSQIPVHRKTGGVVPEVAAREHAVRLPHLLDQLSKRIPKQELRKRVDAVAVTAGPGLMTSLLVGVEVAKTIALAWEKPIIPVNHLEGHIYANLLQVNLQNQKSKVISQTTEGKTQMTRTSARGGSVFDEKTQNYFKFPLLVLIVSGGHTELVLMKRHLNYELLGSTRDDAAGEAFDKTAKLLGLPYPGGPVLSRLAMHGNPHAVLFPRPMLDHKDLAFSFSGLKTSVSRYLQLHKHINKADVAASIEEAIVATLVGKTLQAVRQRSPAGVIIAGGVSANRVLRTRLQTELRKTAPAVTFLKPELRYATDNAAMIGAAGVVRYLNNKTTSPISFVVNPHLPLR